MKLTLTAMVILISASYGSAAAQTPKSDQGLLGRHYREGEKLTYRMKGVNEKWHYEIQADGVVKKDSSGYFEEYAWSRLISDGKEATLPPATVSFRQQLTLDPNHSPSFPNFSQVDLRLVGPITDLLTFYADLWLAIKTGQVKRAGDHFYFKRSSPNSWADGNYVLLGEDSIDFDITLKEVRQSDQTIVLVVRHVPPEKPEVKLPADWMRQPVAGTPNNWVQVTKGNEGKYIAAVGKETFDVHINLSMVDGSILSGTLDNPVETIERECSDAALTKCGDARRHHIMRQIEIKLER